MSHAAGTAAAEGAQLAELEHVAQRIARRYTFPGAERDDVLQVARIGILTAIRSHDGRSPIEAFAHLVALRDVQDALTRSRRSKHAVLTGAKREARVDDDDPVPVVDLLPAPAVMVEQAEARDDLRSVVSALPTLTELERSALARLLAGQPYAHDKSADNALQRARGKLRRAVEHEPARHDAAA